MIILSKKNNLRNRKLNEGGYGALNLDMNTSMLGLKLKVCFIHNSSLKFYLYHVDNDVLWSFLQMQNNWTPRKLKQERYQALNPDRNTSILCLKIEMNFIIIPNKIFHLNHEDSDVFYHSFNYKTNGELES